MVDNRTAVTAVLALVAVLALGVSAATLDSATTTTASGGFGVGSSSSTGIGDDESNGVDLGGGGDTGPGALSVSVCVPFLTRPLVQFALLVGVALFFGAVYRTIDSVVLSGMFTVSALFPFGVLYLALVSCGERPTAFALSLAAEAANASGISSGGGQAGMNAAGEAVSMPTALAGLLLVVAILGSVALLFVSTGDDDEAPAEEEPDTPDPEQRAAVGMAAGAAADRLEADADLENEVFRAWREMTDLLDVDRPRSSTPAEFATAAVDAGMDRGDVLALTEVFEEVRYGGADPTADRERRAIDALRRIEATYSEDGENDDGDGR